MIIVIIIIIKRSCNYFTNAYASCTYHAMYVNICLYSYVHCLVCDPVLILCCVGKTCSHWLSNKMFEFEMFELVITMIIFLQNTHERHHSSPVRVRCGVSFMRAWCNPGLILSLRTANERRRYFVTTSLIGWAQA